MADHDTQVLTRCFAAGRADFFVRCPSAALSDVVEALFVDLHDASNSASCSEIVLEKSGDGSLTLRVDNGPGIGNQSPNAVLAGLVTAVSRLSLDADPDRLHLHCAGLSFDGRGVLISASSGTGKSTLAAALAQRGWTYVSDEAVSLHESSTTAAGFAKPLLIKPGGGELLPGIAAARVTVDSEDEHWLPVPVSALPAPIEDELTPTLIVILHRAPDGSTDARPVQTPLHPADAVVELMGRTMDAERFGPAAVGVLAGLAAGCRCVALQVGPLDEAASVLQDLVQSATEPHQVRALVRPDGDGEEWQVADEVRSVMIGERAVVHDTAGGAIAALDEAGTGVWLALHGEVPSWWQPEALSDPGILAFLDQLESHRLVSRANADEPTGA